VHKKFNTTGRCVPELHYMVDTGAKIDTILSLFIRQGEYFTINRARQYGKTTTLFQLADRMKNDFLALHLSFEDKQEYFASLEAFANGLRMDIDDILTQTGNPLATNWKTPVDTTYPIRDLKQRIGQLCRESGKPVVLMIDEVDRASDYDVFAVFLGMLRDMYLNRGADFSSTFLSVILAGVHDIKNLKKKIRPESEHGLNSPWNIAVNFDVDMSFSALEIQTMLNSYDADRHTGMDIAAIADRLYFYSHGYPFLVSRLCKTIDETPLDWSPQGVDDAETALLGEKNTLFDDLIKNVENNPSFGAVVESILLGDAPIVFETRNSDIDLGVMYGILVKRDGKTCVSNIVFETVLYNYFISVSRTRNSGEKYAAEKSWFIKDGRLDMDAVMSRFDVFMKSEYRDGDGSFIEKHARLLFLSFLKPIVNGTGHYAVEPETRGNRRMDVVVFYGREEYIVELKIWRGEEAEKKGYDQLADYLKSRNRKKGWLLSFADTKKALRESRTVEHNGCEISETIIAYRAPKISPEFQ
jgi:hypothetical protein